MIRLGGPVWADPNDVDAWVAAHKRAGYTACYCSLDGSSPSDAVRELAAAAAKADLMIAEVGAWSSPLAPDGAAREAALEHCKRQLDVADRIGARCCVNIAGSRGEKWDGPDPRDMLDETFDMIVETVREIVDAVQPTRTYYTLETMPWMFPHTAECYERLLRAVGRERFAVHLDPVNMVNSPCVYFNNGAMIREAVERLGPWIKSCHAKDIVLGSNLTTHLDECRPGTGGLDYRALLESLDAVVADVPLMLEHMTAENEYAQASGYIRAIARACGVPLYGED